MSTGVTGRAEHGRGWFVAGLLLAVGGVVFFSLRPIFIKLAYAWVTDPVTLLALRMVFSVPFFIAAAPVGRAVYRPVRRKVPDERRSIPHKFSIGGHEGYITVGLFEDGSPGEIFITMAKEGSTISGLMDSFATTVSYALQ